jgi:hypothetical protein
MLYVYALKILGDALTASEKAVLAEFGLDAP